MGRQSLVVLPESGHGSVMVTASAQPSHVSATDARAEPYRRVLLATDLSEASEAATNAAIRLAIEHGAVLLVCSIVDPERLRLPGGGFLRRIDQERAEVASGARQVVARARDRGANATYLVWDGDPPSMILAAAASEHADAIVMGTHGRGRLGRLLMGSTSKRVAAEARCLVIVVPS